MSKKQGPNRGNKGQDTKQVKRVANAKKEQKKRHPVWTTVKITSFCLSSLVVLGLAGGAGYVASMLRGLPKVSAATFSNNRAASIVYGRNGKIIGRFDSDGDRQPISSTKQVSPYLVNSFIAAEDKTFYSNIGINPLAMARAVVQDLFSHRIESGASTITQQTVKLAVFPEQLRTTHRKIQEIALALEVNHQLTKDEIMTDYMNWVYMGRMGANNVYGVKRASEILFQKDPKNLTLAEASFLAAIPNNPSYFSPYQYPKHTLQRQHYILQQMLKNNMISQQKYNKALNVNVVKEIHPAPTGSLSHYPYLMLDEIKPRVLQELVSSGLYDNKSDAEAALYTSGLKIYTTIDLSKQDDVNRVLQDSKLFKGTDEPYYDPKTGKKLGTDPYQAGVTIIDNKTGGILAVGGGRSYREDNIDHADIARQSGSSIKPLLDYGPAIDQEKLTAGSVLYDAPTSFQLPDKVWSPQDDENNFEGLISARRALYESRNVPAIDILENITPQVGFSYLNKMGMGPNAKTLTGRPTITADDEKHLSSAIGGLDYGVTVEQITSAYSTFPNQGVWHQDYMIQKIDDETGRTIYTAHPKTEQVFSPATSYIITSILHDVAYHPGGTAPMIGAAFPGQYISGKTGTTDSLGDGWFIGYTQKYTTGIWMGYNHHQRIQPGRVYNLKFTIWDDIMKPILKKHPAKKPWPKPANVVTVDVSSLSGMLPTPLSKVHGTVLPELYIDGTQPTQKDDVDVQAKYVVIGGKKYLATTNTPPQDVKTGVFIKLPSDLPDMAHKVKGGETMQSKYLLPTQVDPRGGQVLEGGDVVNDGQLSAPANVQGVLQGATVQLTWKAVDGAKQYEVFRATSADGPFVDLGSTTNPSYTDNALPANADQVYYIIYAQSDNAMSSASVPYGIQLTTPVEPPGTNTTGATGPTGNTTDNSTNTGGANGTPGANSTTGSGSNSTMGQQAGTTEANGTGNTTNLPTKGTANSTHEPPTKSGKTVGSTTNWVPGLGGVTGKHK